MTNSTQEKIGLGGDHPFIERAKNAIEKLENRMNMRKFYENDSWYAVNVKRYNDRVDSDDLKKLALEINPGVTPDDELPRFVMIGGVINDLDSMYQDWLQQEWEQLNYEISDIVSLGMRDKPFTHISDTWKKDRKILSLGRSGGWSCFKMSDDESAIEELQEAIELYNDKESDDEITPRMNDVLRLTVEVEEIIKEIEDIKDHIHKFNGGLDFKQEVKYRMEQINELITKETELKIYDNGGETVDRYTIIKKDPVYGDEAYGMSDNPQSPQGFNQYIGDPSKFALDALGKEITFSELNLEVKTAIGERIGTGLK